MRKITMKILVGTAVMLCLYAVPVYAGANSQNRSMTTDNNTESAFLPEGTSSARDVKNNGAKGSIISTAIADITDLGGGKVRMTLETLAHVSCDKIRHKGYLERWDDAKQSWVVAKTVDYTEVKEDQDDGTLPFLMHEITVTGQKVGSYYRVRGTHTATLNGRSETLNTTTEGILLSN